MRPAEAPPPPPAAADDVVEDADEVEPLRMEPRSSVIVCVEHDVFLACHQL
jgi:hypothetical protein